MNTLNILRKVWIFNRVIIFFFFGFRTRLKFIKRGLRCNFFIILGCCSYSFLLHLLFNFPRWRGLRIEVGVGMGVGRRRRKLFLNSESFFRAFSLILYTWDLSTKFVFLFFCGWVLTLLPTYQYFSRIIRKLLWKSAGKLVCSSVHIWIIF